MRKLDRNAFLDNWHDELKRSLDLHGVTAIDKYLAQFKTHAKLWIYFIFFEQ